MDMHILLCTVVGLFVVAALGGLVMLVIRMGGSSNPPIWLAMLHGMLGAAGLTLLLFGAFTVGIPALAQIALGLLLIAAGGGIVMNLGYHWRGRPIPKSLMFLHAVLAIAGFLALLMATMATAP